MGENEQQLLLDPTTLAAMTVPVTIHEQLNPLLWDTETNKLLPDVREALLGIYNDFLMTNFTDNSVNIPVVDLQLLGSQAGYNYTEHSDIDLHLLVNFELLYEKDEVLQLLYQTITRKFNSDLNINIKGIPVELYIQDLKSVNKSTGVYSVFEDRWVQDPGYPPVVSQETINEANRIANLLIAEIKKTFTDRNEDDVTFSDVEQLINDIYVVRKQFLTEFDEFSAGNLAFKILRNTGILDGLKELHKEKRSKELSLSENNKTSLLSIDNQNKQMRGDLFMAKRGLKESKEPAVKLLKEDNSYHLGDEVTWNGSKYIIIEDSDEDLRLRPVDRFDDLDFDDPDAGDPSEDVYITLSQLLDEKRLKEDNSQETFADTSLTSTLTALVNSEIEAINLYTSAIDSITCEKTQDVLKEILQDEKDHINLLSNLIDSLVSEAFPSDETVESVLSEEPGPEDMVAVTTIPGIEPIVALSEDADDDNDEVDTETVIDELRAAGYEVDDDNTFSVTNSETGYTATVMIDNSGIFNVTVTESDGSHLETVIFDNKDDLQEYLSFLDTDGEEEIVEDEDE